MKTDSNRNPGTRGEVEIPVPSRRGFGYPLPLDALPYLMQPRGFRFSVPYRDCHGNVVTWNGALAVRIRSFLPEGIEVRAQPFEAIDYTLPWPEPEEAHDRERWRMLDDVSGQIWKFPPKAPFFAVRGGDVVANILTSVEIGMGAVVPLPMLQLAARLPRCQVDIDTKPGGPVRFVWNGGEAVIRHVRNLPAPAFAIFTPRLRPY